MKMKLLASAITVSLPMLFGAAYAQTTTTPETGNNRSANGTSTAPNQSPSSTADRNQAGGSTGQTPGSGASGGTTTTGAGSESGAAGTGSGTSGAAGSGATGAGTGAGGTGTTGTGSTGAGATGTGAAGAGGAGAGTGAGATGAGTTGAGAGTAGSTNATAPGMESHGDAAASTEAITGWSAKDDIIGKTVVNENDEKIGDINDIVISSDGRSMYLLIGAGGFLGMGSKDVAVPFDRFERNEDRILLSGYTKEQLKALPEVETRR